jgi:transposase
VLRKLLPKRGNSNTEERTSLMKKFIEIFWKWSIGLLLADREFIWREWILWLMRNKIEFILRVRNNTKIEWYGNARHIFHPFRYDKMYSPRRLKRKRKVWWIGLYITWMKVKDEYLIVISANSRKNAIEEYWMRREIESLFWCLKSRGFNFEETHLQNPDRISTMMWVLSICLVWAHTVWEWKSSIAPILTKKHGRKQYSIFRYGLDYLRDIFENIIEFSKDFFMVLGLLSCT